MNLISYVNSYRINGNKRISSEELINDARKIIARAKKISGFISDPGSEIGANLLR